MLQLPFGITSIKKLYDNTEKGQGGYYPFGSHNFWHSGIHIHTESTNVFEAVLPGTVIAYRIAQKYEMFPLPTMILDDEAKARYKKHLELYNSEEAEFAETIESSKNNGVTEYRTVKRTIYRLKGDLPDEKKKIEKATGFILLEHEYKIKDLEKPLVFYSLYVNLAPTCEIKEENEESKENIYKKFVTDGATHYLKPSERFEVYKIGAAGLDEEKRFIDYAVFTHKQSIFQYKINPKIEESERKKIFDNAESINTFYTRNDKKIDFKKTIIPPRSTITVTDEVISGNKTAKKITFISLAVYLPSSAMTKPVVGKKSKLNIDISKVWISSIEIEDKTIDNFPALKEVKEFMNSELRKGNEFVVENILGTQPQIVMDIDEPKEFWVIDGENNLALPEVGKSFELEKKIFKNQPIYEECPIYSEFSEKTDNVEKEEITGFSNNAYLDKDKNEYYEALNKKGIFVKKEDAEKCYVSPFEWNKFFNDETTMDGGIICNRTHLFLKYDKTNFLKDISMEHEYITSKELNLVYGNKGDFEGAGKLREEIRKVVCRHSIELDSKLFNNIQKEYSKHKDWGCKGYIDKNYFLKELEKTDVWNDGLEKEFRKNDFYFVHPVYFLSHLNRAGIITINPYNGLSYEKIHGGDIGKNVDKTKIVTDNPGFASVWSNTGKAPNHNINGFAAITGFFNEDFAGLKGYEKAKHYYHEGVDFRGIEGKTEIVSFIYGTVLAYGRLEKYGRAIFVSDDNSNGLYLLAHLKYYNKTLLDNKVIRPGDIVGYVGTSGEGTSEQDCDGKYASHLHITYFPDANKSRTYVEQAGNEIRKTTDYNDDFIKTKRNPFIHDSEPKGNND